MKRKDEHIWIIHILYLFFHIFILYLRMALHISPASMSIQIYCQGGVVFTKTGTKTAANNKTSRPSLTCQDGVFYLMGIGKVDEEQVRKGKNTEKKGKMTKKMK